MLTRKESRDESIEILFGKPRIGKGLIIEIKIWKWKNWKKKMLKRIEGNVLIIDLDLNKMTLKLNEKRIFSSLIVVDHFLFLGSLEDKDDMGYEITIYPKKIKVRVYGAHRTGTNYPGVYQGDRLEISRYFLNLINDGRAVLIAENPRSL